MAEPISELNIPVPEGEKLERNRLYLLVFDQRGFLAGMDTPEEAREHFNRAEAKAFGNYIISDIIEVRVSTKRKDWDYLIAVRAGALGWHFAEMEVPTAWYWGQRIAKMWSDMVHGYVVLTGIYYAPEENPIPDEIPQEPPSPFVTALQWVGIGLLSLFGIWALKFISGIIPRRD